MKGKAWAVHGQCGTVNMSARLGRTGAGKLGDWVATEDGVHLFSDSGTSMQQLPTDCVQGPAPSLQLPAQGSTPSKRGYRYILWSAILQVESPARVGRCLLPKPAVRSCWRLRETIVVDINGWLITVAQFPTPLTLLRWHEWGRASKVRSTWALDKLIR